MGPHPSRGGREVLPPVVDGDVFSEIETLIRARYPILYIVSWEEERIERGLIRIAKKLGKNAFTWSVTRGITPAGASIQSKKVLTEGSTDPVSGLREVLERMDPSLYLFKDFHPYLSNPEVVRVLRDLAGHLRSSPKTLVLLSPRPEEISDFLQGLVGDLGEKGRVRVELDSEAKERLVRALGGLTLEEAENVLAKSMIVRSALDGGALPSVLSEKKQVIRKSGVLEYLEFEEGLDRVGGLSSLKDWFRRRSLAFSDRARIHP